MNDEYFFIQSALNGLVLDLRGGASTEGTDVVTAARAFGPAADSQLWQFDADGYVRNKKAGLVLDVFGGQGKPLTKLVIWRPNEPAGTHPTPNQRWTHTEDGHLVSGLFDVQTPLVMDLLYGSTALGATVGVFSANVPTTSNQVWQLFPESAAYADYCFLESELNGLVLDLAGGATAADTEVVTASRASGPAADSQLWQLTPDGYLRNKKSGMVLSAVSASPSQAPKPVIRPAQTGTGDALAAQHWTLTASGHLSAAVTSDGNAVVLDITRGDPAPGVTVGLWPENHPASANQTWQLIAPTPELPTYCYMQNAANGLVLALRGGTGAGASDVVSARQLLGGADAQLWQLGADGFVRNKQTGTVLTVSGRQPGARSKLVAADPVSTSTPVPTQAWRLTSRGNLLSQVATDGSLVADLLDGDQDTGAAACLAERSDPVSPTQHWRLIRQVPRQADVVGRAAKFDGFNGYVQAQSCPVFSAADFTLETWFRTGPRQAGGPLITTGFGMDPDALAFLVNRDGSLLLRLSHDQDAQAPLMVASTVPTDVHDGAWHHLAVVRRGTEASFFLNGVPLAPSGRSSDVRPAQPVALDRQTVLALAGFPLRTMPRFDLDCSAFLDGELDEVRLWSYARSPQEIARGVHLLADRNEPALAGRWSFDTGDFRDNSSYARGGSSEGAEGTAVLVPSELELVGSGAPYLITQAKLTQDWVSGGAGPREITGYRVVISARSGAGHPMATNLTLGASAPVDLYQFSDIPIHLPGDGTEVTVPTDSLGELTFTIDARGALTCPLLKLRADFMGADERIVFAPDETTHARLARLTGRTLLGQDSDGRPLPSVASGRRPAPLPKGTDPKAADALAQAVTQVMSTAVAQSLQTDRPLTRSAEEPLAFLQPVPQTPRYQDPGLAPRGVDPGDDVIGTYYLPRDEDVARVLVPEQDSAPCWLLSDKAFTPLADKDVADTLSGLTLTHTDAYAELLAIDAPLFAKRRTITLDADALQGTAKRELARPWGEGGFADQLQTAAKIMYTTVKVAVSGAGEAARTLDAIVVTVITNVKDAATGLLKALDAVILTVEDAVAFVGGALRRFGGKIADLLGFIRDLFDWDDVLLTQDVLTAYTVNLAERAKTVVHNGAQMIVDGVERFRGDLHQHFQDWRALLTAPPASGFGLLADQAAAVQAVPLDVKGGYLIRMVNSSIGVIHADKATADQFRAVAGPFAAALTDTVADLHDRLGSRLDLSGFAGALESPEALLTGGLDLILQAAAVLADQALILAEDAVGAIVGLIDEFIDGFIRLLRTPIDIRFVSALYRKVTGQQLTILGMLTLAAALSANVIHKSRFGVDQPLFTKAQRDAFLALKPADYGWIHDPFARALTDRSASGDAATVTARDAGAVDAYAFSVAMSALAGTAELALWGVNIYSDSLWIPKAMTRKSSSIDSTVPKQHRLVHPVGLLNLGAQWVLWTATAPWNPTDDTPGKLGATLWAIQLVPMISNSVAVSNDLAGTTFQWGALGDPVLTGGVGYISMVLSAFLCWQQVSAAQAMPADTPAQTDARTLALNLAATSGTGNLLGGFTWAIQLIKALPVEAVEAEAPELWGALLLALIGADLFAYPTIAGTLFTAAALTERD